MNNDLRNTLIGSDNVIIQTQQELEGDVPLQERGLGGAPLQEGITQLAIDVGHVSDLFSDLALLVNYQGTTIDNIQTNIENSSNNIERANKQLVKANRYQIAKNRCTCRCIFFLLITLLILVIILIIKMQIKN